jgi:hypothetical protein
MRESLESSRLGPKVRLEPILTYIYNSLTELHGLMSQAQPGQAQPTMF